MSTYETIHDTGNHPIKLWTKGVRVEDKAKDQLRNIASMPFIHRWVAAMPDVHLGKGATIGSVIPTKGAIIPAAVGVDIGCGMMAAQTSLHASDLPDSLAAVRSAIERDVPHGRSKHFRKGDKGSWKKSGIPKRNGSVWAELLEPRFRVLCDKHPHIERSNHVVHLGTLGTGNHFIEVCLDEAQRVWIMLHSGSRGVGNRIGSYFIEKAKEDMGVHLKTLPDRDLAYLEEGTEHFEDYIEAVSWAQDFARCNRQLMMAQTVGAMKRVLGEFDAEVTAVNCHHNYVAKEIHYGEEVFVTRKGAVRAGRGEMGIIPGSMGTRSYIVRGKGDPESFCSCSHGAGRAMSRTAARKTFTLADHARMTEGVECRKDADVIDETPAAYKPIEAVMAAQSDLVEVVHTLRQVVCVKG